MASEMATCMVVDDRRANGARPLAGVMGGGTCGVVGTVAKMGCRGDNWWEGRRKNCFWEG